jgi:hypothetical protein
MDLRAALIKLMSDGHAILSVADAQEIVSVFRPSSKKGSLLITLMKVMWLMSDAQLKALV